MALINRFLLLTLVGSVMLTADKWLVFADDTVDSGAKIATSQSSEPAVGPPESPNDDSYMTDSFITAGMNNIEASTPALEANKVGPIGKHKQAELLEKDIKGFALPNYIWNLAQFAQNAAEIHRRNKWI